MNHGTATDLQGLWRIEEGSARRALEGFSGVRASFLKVILNMFEEHNTIYTEERITTLREVLLMRKR